MATTQRTSSSGLSIARAVPARPPWAARPPATQVTVAVPPQARKRSTPQAPNVAKVIVPLAAGGAAGGIVSVALVKMGMSPNMALGSVAVAGAAGVYALRGSGRLVAGGAAGLAAGQLVIGIIAKRLAKTATKPANTAAPAAAQPVATAPRQDAFGGMTVDQAFRNARAEMDEDDDS